MTNKHKRKYYKRCKNHYAWRFAPTGALQSIEATEFRKLPKEDQELMERLIKRIWINAGVPEL